MSSQHRTTGSPPAPGTTLSEVGEFGVLALFTPRFPLGDDVELGPGDDAAVVRVDGGRALVATDVLVDGRHFRRDWATAADIGHRAAAQSLSDLNAMGGRATAVTVGLAAPEHLELSWLLEMGDGLAEECAEVGASVVGGDLTRCEVLMISVTAVGVVDGEPLRRSGARPGDVLALRGRQGWAAAGLAVLGRGFRSPRAVVEAYRRPEVPYAGGAEALAAGATSLIDVSDGLLADLGHVAAASEVTIDVTSGAFDLEEPLRSVGAALGVDPLTFVFGGGDDHALAGTFPVGATLPEGWRIVGAVGEAATGQEEAAARVTVDGAAYDGETGFQHF